MIIRHCDKCGTPVRDPSARHLHFHIDEGALQVPAVMQMVCFTLTSTRTLDLCNPCAKILIQHYVHELK